MEIGGKPHNHGRSNLQGPEAALHVILQCQSQAWLLLIKCTIIQTLDKVYAAGYAVQGTETRVCYVEVEEGGKVDVEAGKRFDTGSALAVQQTMQT